MDYLGLGTIQSRLELTEGIGLKLLRKKATI